MKRVFIDTSVFFAHLVAEDRHHVRAKTLFQRAARESWPLITTNAVVWETFTLIRVRARTGLNLGLGFLQDIQDGICEIHRIQGDDEARAVELLRRHDDKVYSFCDALSFVVMERLKITDVLAFDQDFASYGKFTLL